jgi:hypothetical protein
MNDIPGTTVENKTKPIRWHKTTSPPIGTRYRADTDEGILIAIVGHEPVEKNGVIRYLWHLSVSFRTHQGEETRTPNWDELKSAKYQLIPVDVPMVLIFPCRAAPYVNVHETCLHLWEAEEGIDQ